MLTRLSKIALVAAGGLFLLIVFFNNLTDYDSNFQFVRHVLSMDTTFPGNQLMGRAMPSPTVHHVFYATIILWEAAASGLMFFGAWKLWRSRHATAPEFQRTKSIAVAGLALSLLQWLVAFITVGGEWFVMWQSKIWNGQEAAGRMFLVMGITLIFLTQRDEEMETSA